MQPQNHIKYFDCHTHLLDFPPKQLQNILNQSYSNGVAHIVSNTINSSQYQTTKQLVAKNHGKIIGCFGVHPWYVAKQSQKQNWKQLLQKILIEKQQYLVGQIGLDYRKDILQNNEKKVQQQFFIEQLELSFQLNKPASVHCVRAHGQMLKIFKKYDKTLLSKDRNVIMHSYGGSKQITKSFLNLQNISIYFSLSLNRKQELCQVIPLNRILIETDAPYQPNLNLIHSLGFKTREQYNQVKNIIPNMLSLSKLYKVEESKFGEIVFINALKAFRIKF